jgi:hypothetical protein
MSWFSKMVLDPFKKRMRSWCLGPGADVVLLALADYMTQVPDTARPYVREGVRKALGVVADKWLGG